MRKFTPIFNATLTPLAAVAVATTKKDVPYGKFQANVALKGGDVTRTVMAFGDQFASVRDLLVEGQPVELAVQHDGGTLKIIGTPREKVAAAA